MLDFPQTNGSIIDLSWTRGAVRGKWSCIELFVFACSRCHCDELVVTIQGAVNSSLQIVNSSLIGMMGMQIRKRKDL